MARGDRSDYKIVREIWGAGGGMGVVYLARNDPRRRQGGPQGRRRTPPQPAGLPRAIPARDPLPRPGSSTPNIVSAYSDLRLGERPRLDHGVCRGHRPLPPRQGQGAAAGRQCLQLRAPGGPRTPARARTRHGPSRHQAGQPDPRSRRAREGRRQGARLRPGQGHRRGPGGQLA